MQTKQKESVRFFRWGGTRAACATIDRTRYRTYFPLQSLKHCILFSKFAHGMVNARLRRSFKCLNCGKTVGFWSMTAIRSIYNVNFQLIIFATIHFIILFWQWTKNCLVSFLLFIFSGDKIRFKWFWIALTFQMCIRHIRSKTSVLCTIRYAKYFKSKCLKYKMNHRRTLLLNASKKCSKLYSKRGYSDSTMLKMSFVSSLSAKNWIEL